jgi:histidinol phosphatase-like PHP family hydrolase
VARGGTQFALCPGVPPLTDPNLEIAALLLDVAEIYRPSPRFWGYKNASRAIRRHPEFLADLTEKEILRIPGVGRASLRIVLEFLEAGESGTARQIIAGSGKRAEIAKLHTSRKNFLSAAMVQKVLSDPKGGTITVRDYLGDFQMHSRGSDGADTVETLAKGCMKRGYACMCVTDHSYGLPIACGMSMQEMREQHAEINKLNKTFGGEFRVLKGVEANILTDGSLDMHPAELAEFDLVVASPHSSLRKAVDQTERMLKAVALPGVHILGHPRGRMFNARAGIVADWPAVFRRAAERGVAIEIDGDVSRQDLDFSMAKAANNAGCLFALDSDAHAANQLWMADYAIAHARLAGIAKDRIINCWPVPKILEWTRTFHASTTSNARTRTPRLP